MRNKSSIWGVTQLKTNLWYYVCFGNLELWLKKDESGELLIGTRRNKEIKELKTELYPLQSGGFDASDETIEWDLYAGGTSNDLTMLPAMPDRPVVLKPHINRHILSGSKTQLLFFVPVWIQLYSGSDDRGNLLCQLPTDILSSTWFGEMQSGELCYALERDLLDKRPAVAVSPYSAVCTLNIQNESQSLLDFQRMAVHLEYLSLYSDGRSLYTNEVFVRFNGVDKISQVKYSSRGPKWSGTITKLKGPREKPGKSLLQKSFYFIKSLTEM
jgi:hypothetical protein